MDIETTDKPIHPVSREDKMSRSSSLEDDKSQPLQRILSVILLLFLIYAVVMSTYAVIAVGKANQACVCSTEDVASALNIIGKGPPTTTTGTPSANPTMQPTVNPTLNPSQSPSTNPSMTPTNHPSVIPTTNPTNNPSIDPTNNPSIIPTMNPTMNPTKHPTMNPSVIPTKSPTNFPTTNPTVTPTQFPTNEPTVEPSNQPTIEPTYNPTMEPTLQPTNHPTLQPTMSVGSIIQIQHAISHTKVTTSIHSSWIEPSTDYRVSITPKYLNSEILISFNFGWNGFGIAENTIILWSAAKSVGSGSFNRNTITSSGIPSGSRHQISGMVQRRNNGHDANDMNFCNWITYDYPNSTEQIIYTLHMNQESVGAGTLRIGESNIDNSLYGWNMPVTIIAIEIKN